MDRGLNAYLSALSEEQPLRPRLAQLRTGTPSIPASTTQTRTEAAVRAGVLPARLPAGSTVLRPLAIPPSLPHQFAMTQPASWAAEMSDAGRTLRTLESEAATRRRAGAERDAGAEWMVRGIHLSPGYTTREYQAPRDGLCDVKSLVWADIWLEAQALLRRFAFRPPRYTPGAAVAAWARDIRAARALMFEAANFRPEFLGLIAKAATTSSIAFDGLATNAQAGGVYTENPRARAQRSNLVVMQFAPQPGAGYEELLGTYLRQDREFTESLTSTSGQHITYTSFGNGIGTSADTPRDFTYNAENADTVARVEHIHLSPFADAAWVGRLLERYWANSTAQNEAEPWITYGLGTAQAPSTFQTRGPRVRLGAMRANPGAWIDNHLRMAAYFGDPRFSLAEVLVRTNGFYLSSYVNFAGRYGLIPREDAQYAAEQGARIRQQALNDFRTVAYTSVGLASAVVSLVPVVGGIIAGIMSALTTLLVELGGAASGGVFYTPVLPPNRRMFAGRCAEASWDVSPEDGVTDPTSPAPTTPTPPTPSPEAGGTGKMLGAFAAIGLGLWLLSGSKR